MRRSVERVSETEILQSTETINEKITEDFKTNCKRWNLC